MEGAYHIANLTDSEKQAITEAEHIFKEKTGKDCVMIAWQKDCCC